MKTFPLPSAFDEAAIMSASAQALASWREQLRAKVASFDLEDNEQLEEAKAMAEDIEAVESEISDREAADAAAAADRAKVEAVLAAEEEANEEDVVAPAEAAADESAETLSDEAPAAEAPAPAPAPEVVDVQAEAEADALAVAKEVFTDAPEPVVSKSASQKAAEMSSAAPGMDAQAAGKEAAGRKTQEFGFTARRTMEGVHAGQALDIDTLAEAASGVANGISSVQSDAAGLVLASATIDKGAAAELSANEFDNFSTIRELQLEANEAHMGSNGLVASGAPCLPTPVDYSFFRLSRAQRPIESMLPRVGAPQGSIRFIVPPNWAYLSNGITVKTCADEEVVPYVDKNVVTVTCPDLAECCVSSVSRIIQFNNLTFRAFRGFTAEAIYQLGVAFTKQKEVMYLNDIDAESTLVNEVAEEMSSNRDMFAAIATAAFGYRKRNGMDMSQPLIFAVNDVIQYINAIDAFRDGANSFGRDPLGTLRTYLADLNIRLELFADLPDNATADEQGAGGVNTYEDAQAAGTDLNGLPTSVAGYLHAPGTFIRLDGGQLNLGLVRDSMLNKQNDLHLFAEQWTKVCKVGTESIKLPIAMCPRGLRGGEINLVCA